MSFLGWRAISEERPGFSPGGSDQTTAASGAAAIWVFIPQWELCFWGHAPACGTTGKSDFKPFLLLLNYSAFTFTAVSWCPLDHWTRNSPLVIYILKGIAAYWAVDGVMRLWERDSCIWQFHIVCMTQDLIVISTSLFLHGSSNSGAWSGWACLRTLWLLTCHSVMWTSQIRARVVRSWATVYRTWSAVGMISKAIA